MRIIKEPERLETLTTLAVQTIQEASLAVSPLLPVEKLTTIENQIVTNAESSEKNPRIREMHWESVLFLCRRIRKLVFIKLGLNPLSQSDEDLIITEMVKVINKHSGLTKNEILSATDKGLDGDYLKEGQNSVFFSVSNFALWIKAYIEDTKKPVMKKHAQFMAQLPEARVELTEEEHLKSAIETLNMYLDTRKKDAAHRVSGAAVLFRRLEYFGITKLNLEEKTSIYQRAMKVLPGGTPDQLQDLARNIAYNQFIDNLIEFGLRLDENGNTIEDFEP